MYDSGLRGKRKIHNVTVTRRNVVGKILNETDIYTDLPATLSVQQGQEIISDAGQLVILDALMYFGPLLATGLLPDVLEKDIITDGTDVYEIISSVKVGGEEDRLRVGLRVVR